MKGTENKKEASLELSHEFKEELDSRKQRNWGSLILVTLITILMFVTLGIGAYQIFYKPEKLETKDSAEKIESKPEVTEPAVTTPAPVSTPAPTTPTPTTPATTVPTTPDTYTVAEGDTLGGIANKFDTTVSELMGLNGITDEGSLQIGEKLKLK